MFFSSVKSVENQSIHQVPGEIINTVKNQNFINVIVVVNIFYLTAPYNNINIATSPKNYSNAFMGGAIDVINTHKISKDIQQHIKR